MRGLVMLSLLSGVASQWPNHPPVWAQNLSTIIMPCNNSGFTDPASTVGWGIIDFDWSNSKAVWATHKPMDDEEMLFSQVVMTTSASPGTTVWVYRCSVYAYPWYTSVRNILDDPAYESWFIKFKPTGPWYSPNFFWDDFWPGASGDFPDASAGRIVEDTGMTTADLVSITDAYNANMAALKAYTIAQGKFSWQMLWTGGDPNGKGSTCPSPLVHKASCASDLRSLCAATSPQQVNRTLMYAFAPGGCKTDPSNLTQFEEDLANFLLVRGPYSYLGHGWLGCSRTYAYPAALNADYGEPTGLCAETGAGTGVFTRDFTKASVQMDCNSWTPTITLK